MAKVYTAHEMRDLADAIAGDLNESGHTSVKYTFDDLIPVIESLRQAADAMEREDKEIDELKKQASIAKDAFFKIAQRKHSREVHDIICEAEFMMNHPECREAVRSDV